MPRKILLLATLFCATAHTAEERWVRLLPQLRYFDLSVACTSSLYPSSAYLSVTLDGGKPVQALLRARNLGDPKAPSIALEPDEVAAITAIEDKEGRFWVTRLPLTQRLITWLLWYIPSDAMGCRPPHPLKSVDPMTKNVEFGPVAEGGPAPKYLSTTRRFSGRNDKGDAYSATLWLEQIPVVVP